MRKIFNNFSLDSKIQGLTIFRPDRMIKRIIYTVTLLSVLISTANGQESISADKSTGCDSMSVLFTLNTSLQLSDYTSILWDFGDGDTASNLLIVSHLYHSPGSYTVKCLLNGTDLIEESDFITIGELPYAYFTFKDSSASESEYRYFFKSVYYKPGDGVAIDYEWQFPDGSIADKSTALYDFMEEGIYEVFLSLTHESGCVDSVRRNIPVYRELKPPNVFSPNGDMNNDYFEVETHADYLYTFRVFSRSGTQVHFTQSNKIIWDGRTTGGREVPGGIYFYVIESKDTPTETQISGFVHLYR